MGSLDLVPFFLPGRQPMIEHLGQRLEHDLALTVRVRSPWFQPDIAYDSSRGQYNSTELLRQLLGGPREPADRVLGVAGVDLFIPVLTYVFGEAQLDGRAAVVSTHRLRPEVYGLPADEALLLERLHKESLHELGHTFGLVHCVDRECVMHVSTYVEEIDLKSSGFCARCRTVVLPAA